MFKNSLIIGLIFLLLGSAYLNVSLIKKIANYSRSINAISLDPVKLKRYPSDPNQTNLREIDQTNVIIFGDSRAEAWPTPTLNHFQVINRGIGGETSAQALLRFDYHVSPLRPTIIVVQVGGNDLRMLPLSPNTRKDIVENCKSNIRQITEKANALGATVILTTIFPLAQGKLALRDRLFWSDLQDIDQDIKDVNTSIRALAGEKVIIFDAYSILEENGKTKRMYAKDLLHINSAGYNALNQKLVEILQSLE